MEKSLKRLLGHFTRIRSKYRAPRGRCEGSIGFWTTGQIRRYATEQDSRAEHLVARQDYQTPFTKLPKGRGQTPIRVDNGAIVVQSRTHGLVPVPGQWLRDMCPCTECRNQDTAQRQVNVFKQSTNCNIHQVRPIDNGNAFEIIFVDGHVTKLGKEAIDTRNSFGTAFKRRGQTHAVETWDSSIQSNPPTVPFSDVETQGLGGLLRKIRVHGFCFVDNTPPTPEATEQLLTSIGPIRNTHYGGFYDFTADLSSKDTAYTSESLEPHTDNTYFTEPAGLQALHLLSHTDGSGGLSSLVDGFHAAQTLHQAHKPSYRLLSRIGVWAHASGNEGISIQPADPHPVIGHDDNSNISQIRWNNADRAGINCSMHYTSLWYNAASRFDAIVNDPQNQYWFQLTPGRVLIFDNWRVLHGRAAFTGKRRMCGGYINRDDFISKFRMTNMTEEEIRSSTVTG